MAFLSIYCIKYGMPVFRGKNGFHMISYVESGHKRKFGTFFRSVYILLIWEIRLVDLRSCSIMLYTWEDPYIVGYHVRYYHWLIFLPQFLSPYNVNICGLCAKVSVCHYNEHFYWTKLWWILRIFFDFSSRGIQPVTLRHNVASWHCLW